MASKKSKVIFKNSSKKGKQGAAGKKKSGDDEEVVASESHWLEPEIGRSIAAIFVFLVSALALLSLIDLAGSFGTYLRKLLQMLFGWGMYVFPVLLIALGIFFLRMKERQYKKITIFGIFLFVLSLFALIHMGRVEQGVSALQVGEGGGYVGMILSYPLFVALGVSATYLVLLSFSVISLLLMFRVSLSQIGLFLTGRKRDGGKHEPDEAAEKDEIEVRGMQSAQMLQKDGQLTRKTVGATNAQSALARKPLATSKPAQNGPGEVRLGAREAQVRNAFNKPRVDSASTPVLRSKTDKNWVSPSLDLLDPTLGQPTSGNIKENAKVIKQTLENFGISVEMGAVSVGPTVTQYTLRPAVGVKLNQIVGLQNDLALALAAHPIRVEAPIPGKSLVGIEVPNESVAMVRLREVLESKEFQHRKSQLSLGLGRDVAGNPVVADLQKMPHMLIAGATGSGKSVCINTLIVSLLYQNSPQDLRFILVDPKRVELSYYNDVPHLLTPVIIAPKKTIFALKWAVAEMERRYKLLSETGKRDIQSYNSTMKDDRLPYIVIVVDELADLMSVAAAEVEAAIVRLAQMARAVGIHLIVATQRPSVDVITGLIKANITTRIAFSVASQIDSRTMIDMSGAEKLLGNGDMLFLTTELSKPKRVQGAFVSEQDVRNVTDAFRAAAKPDYNTDVVEPKNNGPQFGGMTTEGGFGGGFGEDGGSGSEDALFEQAKQVVIQTGKGSASLLQRRLRVGYARAARLLDILEEHGIVGPPDGSRPREVLVKQDSLQSMSSMNAEEPETAEDAAFRDLENEEIIASAEANADEPIPSDEASAEEAQRGHEEAQSESTDDPDKPPSNISWG